MISVVIPCYNAARWIRASIDSALEQDYPACEVIVVDDGSTDDTPVILNAYADRIRIVRQANGGVSKARNVGVDSANGEYIKFLDADDLLPPGSLSVLARLSRLHPSAVIIGRAAVLGGYKQVSYDIARAYPEGAAIDREFLFTHAVSSGLYLLPRILFLRAGGFDPSIRLGEEFDFFLRLCRKGAAFISCDSTVYHVRDHDGPRLSRSASTADHLRQREVISAAVDYLARSGSAIDGLAKKRIYEMLWSNGRHCARQNMFDAASAYFASADGLGWSNRRPGSRFYRLLAAVLDPIYAERLLETVKSSISRR